MYLEHDTHTPLTRCGSTLDHARLSIPLQAHLRVEAESTVLLLIEQHLEPRGAPNIGRSDPFGASYLSRYRVNQLIAETVSKVWVGCSL